MNRSRTIFLTGFILLVLLVCFTKLKAQSVLHVKILPGVGIVVNKDSIILDQTTIPELNRLLKLPPKSATDNEESGNLFDSIVIHSDGYNPETMQQVGGDQFIKEIQFKSINFHFSSFSGWDDLKLKSITIRENRELVAITNKGLKIGMFQPNVSAKYKVQATTDYISDDGLYYHFYSQGISFQLEKSNSDRLKLIEVSTYLKQ
jgi:hypothetical protein